MSSAIIVPARYASSRFPGKPLAMLGGQTMVERTFRNAQKAADDLDDCVALIATDDSRIATHCVEAGLRYVMTDPDLPSGSDRALAAVESYENSSGQTIDIIVNLQGDSPFTPAHHVISVLDLLRKEPEFEVATPYIQLSWEALDQMREDKVATPFSGTTIVCAPKGKALWFSKNILPAIRKEEELRKESPLSPVCRHIGLYAYRKAALQKFVSLPQGHWEKLEGLEQLRCLENGVSIGGVQVEPSEVAISGIDTPEDLRRAEAILAHL